MTPTTATRIAPSYFGKTWCLVIVCQIQFSGMYWFPSARSPSVSMGFSWVAAADADGPILPSNSAIAARADFRSIPPKSGAGNPTAE